MVPLRLAGIVVTLVSATPSNANTVARWEPFIAEASQRFGVPTHWIERVMRAESNGQTMLKSQPIRSRAGAMGLMQLMPKTWEMLRQSLGLGPNPDDPRDNILAGTLYLRMMYERFGYPGMFAAYDAGPGRFAVHLASGRPLPDETIAYLRRVTEPGSVAKATVESMRRGLFMPIGRLEIQHSAAPSQPSPTILFAVRNDDP